LLVVKERVGKGVRVGIEVVEFGKLPSPVALSQVRSCEGMDSWKLYWYHSDVLGK
jgi:hypothetical protein